MQTEDFFSHYLTYTAGGEVPVCFHRWSAIVGISALLERNAWVEFGHTDIYPNMYSMLIGSSGTRKSSAIVLMKKLLIKAGYNTIAAQRTSKEKYLHDLSMHTAPEEGVDILEQNLFGGAEPDLSALCTPSLIAADEANDFFGYNNIDFLSMLGSLWDYSGTYENKIKSGVSDRIPNPTITILAGNTPTGFAAAFPSEILGQGFFSRLLLVYGEPNGTKITIPTRPSNEATHHIVTLLQAIRQNTVGSYEFTKSAYSLFDQIYKTYTPLQDPRFESYCNRRLIHLIKLCLITAAARLEKEITELTVLQANTYLTYIEQLMPRAMGEFGKGKSSDIVHKVMQFIHEAESVVTVKDMWRHVSSDLDKVEELHTIIRNLNFAEKIQVVTGGFLPIRSLIVEEKDEPNGLVSYETFLTEEEMRVSK